MGCSVPLSLIGTTSSIFLNNPLVIDERHGKIAAEIMNGGDLVDFQWAPDEVTVRKEDVYLRDGKQETEYSERPPVGHPCLFNGGVTMSMIVVVIDYVAIQKMISERLLIKKCFFLTMDNAHIFLVVPLNY